MPRPKLPSIRFETGICIHRLVPPLYPSPELKPCRAWFIIGRLEDDTPFMLSYSRAITNWWSNANLGASLRNKILKEFAENVRRAPVMPAYITVHDVSEIDRTNINAGGVAAGEITMPFIRDVWRNKYLDDRDEDYMALNVPFAEKEAAKALGAKWDGAAKVWRVKKQGDMRAFSRWMQATEEASPH